MRAFDGDQATANRSITPLAPSKENLTVSNGQEHVKRALEVAAAGSHNMMMVGPPGADKTLLARSMPSILPVSP